MTQHPNILWLMTDEQRADSLGYAGTPWAHTPHLDRLARAGTRFSAAYTPSPVCVPARASVLTGRAASSIGVLNNHHALRLGDLDLLPWHFTANGYQVASFGKKHYNCYWRAFDSEMPLAPDERVHYYHYKVPVDARQAGVVRYDGGRWPWLFAGRYPGTVDDTPEAHAVRGALDWARGRDRARPFFLRLSFRAPHTPVVTPAPFDRMIDPEAIDLPLDYPAQTEFVSATHREHLYDCAGTFRLTPGQVRRARQCYYGHVAFVDHLFGRLLEALDEMGALENTIVACVSDHGTHLGDHGFFQKQSYWDVSARVPLFFTGPGPPSGPGVGIRQGEVSTPVSAGSLLPTLMDLAGLEIPPSVQYPSLAPALRDGLDVPPAPVFSEIDYGLWGYRPGERYVMVRDGRWKLCLYRSPLADDGPSPERETNPAEDRVLYDLEADPGERHNLAPDAAYGQVMERLVDAIDAWDRGRPIVHAFPIG
jgi:arylsulfatase A-like enzyme